LESKGRRVRTSGQEPEQLPEPKLVSRKVGPAPEFFETKQRSALNGWKRRRFT
jgi:hypothetical protein